MKKTLRRLAVVAAAVTNIVVLVPSQANAIFASLTCAGATEAHTVSDIIEQSEGNHYWKHTSSIYPKHTFTLTMSGGDVDLFVYDNSSCSSLACSSARGSTATDSCTVNGLPLSGTVFKIRVRYWAGSPAGNDINYTLAVTSGV